MAKTIAALQVALDLESAAFVTQTDAAKRKAKELGDTLQATSETVQKSGNAAREAAGGFELATRQKSQMGDVARNAGYQIQDFAVQVGSGTSATQALTQQLPQLLSAFGAVGVVLGTVAAVTIPLLSAGFTALVGTMKSVEDAAKDVASAAAEFTAANNAAGQSLKEISEKYYANAAPALKALYEQLRTIAQLKLGDQLREFAGSLVNQFASVARLAIPEIFKPFLDSPAQKLGKEFGIAEQEAMRLLTTLRKFQSGEVNFESLRDQVLGLNLQQRQATESGRTQIQQLLKFLAQAQEALNQKTNSEIRAEGEAKKADDAAKRRAQSEAERLKREAEQRARATAEYIAQLDQQIRKLREGEEAARLFEAAKHGPQAVARMRQIIELERAKKAQEDQDRSDKEQQRQREQQAQEDERNAERAAQQGLIELRRGVRQQEEQDAETAAAELQGIIDRLEATRKKELEFEDRIKQAHKSADEAFTQAENAADDYNNGLAKQIFLLGLGEEKARLYEARLKGGAAAEALMAQLIAAEKLVAKEKELKQMLDEIKERTDTDPLTGELFLLDSKAQRAVRAASLGPDTVAANRALERAEEVDRFQKMLEKAREPLEKYHEQVAGLQLALADGVITTENYVQIVTMYAKELQAALKAPDDGLKELMRAIDRTGEKFTDTFVKMATTGKATFRDMVNVISEELLRLTVKKYITTPLFDMFKAFLPSTSVGAPGKASGGPVEAGAPYLVGERGPELFVPAFRGTVVANDKLGGSTIVNNYNIQAIDVKSFEDRLLASNKTVFAANMYAQKSLSPQGRA